MDVYIDTHASSGCVFFGRWVAKRIVADVHPLGTLGNIGAHAGVVTNTAPARTRFCLAIHDSDTGTGTG